MQGIQWTTDKTIRVGPYRIPLGPEVKDGYNQGAGCRRNTPVKRLLKRLFYPLVKFQEDLMVDGFIESQVGARIRKYMRSDTVFLEIGCGDMSLRRFIPKGVFYNCLDLELTDFHVLNALRDPAVNLACATATKLPVPDNVVTLMVSTEVLEHIPEIDKAVKELHRVCAPDAVLVGSIPNNLCYKYDRKGKNLQHINEWSQAAFVNFMASHGFELIETKMIGKWVELPKWISKRTYQLPISSADEYHNSNFIFSFRVRKCAAAKS